MKSDTKRVKCVKGRERLKSMEGDARSGRPGLVGCEGGGKDEARRRFQFEPVIVLNYLIELKIKLRYYIR